MGNPAGVKRDFDALEARRFRALDLLKQGLSEAEVARQVGAHRQSVNRWAMQAKQDGVDGLKKAGRAGRKPLLTDENLERLEELLKQGPEALGYETGLWTAWRVADVIKREFGVAYHPGHVWRILGSIGWSCQRPTGRAIERNEEAILEWKTKRWPQLKKKPAERAKRSSSSTKAD